MRFLIFRLARIGVRWQPRVPNNYYYIRAFQLAIFSLLLQQLHQLEKLFENRLLNSLTINHRQTFFPFAREFKRYLSPRHHHQVSSLFGDNKWHESAQTTVE